MTVEKLTLGQGFITEPTATVVKSDTTCAQLLDTILGDGNYKYTGQINDGMYLTSIKDSEETVDIPSYISQKAGTIGKRRSGEWLSELDYTNMAGWMYSVNDKFPSETASSKTLKDGDVIRWQFTIYGYGADIGKDSSSFGIPSLKTLADKKKLIKLVADLRQEYKDSELKQNAEYVAALDALAKIDSTQSEIDSAYKALDKADFSEGSESGSGSSSKKVSVGISFSEVKNEDESTTVTAKIATTADSFNVALDKAAIAKLADKAQCLKIRAGKTDIVIPQAVFKSLAEVSADGAEIEIDHTSQKGKDNIKVSFTRNSEKLDVNGEIHVELPFDAGEFEDCVTVRGGVGFNYENGIVSLEIQPNTEYNTVISPIGRLKDVPGDAEYAEALDSLMEKGIIKGVGNGYFEPDGRFTTGMLAAMMYRQSGHETSGLAWYVAPMEWAVGNGYLKNGDSFMSVDADIMNYAMKLFLKKDDFSAHGGEMTRAEGTLNYFRFMED